MKKQKEKKAYTAEELQTALKDQNDNHGWTFYQERDLIENLFQTRFNFLLTVYALFITAFAACENPVIKKYIWIAGMALVILMELTVYRMYIKLDVAYKILEKLGKNAVVPIIENETNSRPYRLFNVTKIIGIYIPILLLLSFIAGICIKIWNISIK